MSNSNDREKKEHHSSGAALRMSEPPPNIVVASPIDPANAATIEFVKAVALVENEEAALRFGCAPQGRR